MASRVLLAAGQGDRKSMETFITDRQVNVVDEEGCTPLMVAAANGRDEIIRLLLEQECLKLNELDKEDEKYVDHQNHYGWTALMQAAINGHLNSVLLLLQHGARVDIQNCWGATALVVASQGGCFGVVHTLINHGANVNQGGTEEVKTLTPLMAAAQSGHLEIVRELLQAGACTDVKLGSTGWTALMLAALNNQASVVELLLQRGAKGDQSDVNNKKASDLAASLGHQDVLSLLAGEKLKKVTVSEFVDAVKSGNVNRVRDILHRQKSLACAKDKEGATPLMYAANKGHAEVCEVLLKNGAEMNVADDKYGWTALMLAVQLKKYEIVKLLGRWGADFSVRGKSGSTARDISNRNGDIEMIRLVSNVERQQQRNAPPTATPIGRSDSQRDQPSFSLKEIQGRIQNAYRLPTPTINVNLPEDGNATPTNPRFNLPGGRMLRGFPSPSPSATPPPTSRLGAGPSSLASSSSSSDHTTSESSTSSAHEQQISRPLFPPGPSSRPDRTGLTRPTSGLNLFSQGPTGRGPNVTALLSKSNLGKAAAGGGGSKPPNLKLKNDGGGKPSSHPLVSPQSNSKFRLPSTPGSPFLQLGGAGGGRSGGNSISSRLLDKRGSASSSGGSSNSSSRQTSLEFPSRSVSREAAAKSLRKRCNTEPISPYLKGGSKGAFKIQSFSSGIADLKRALEEASLGRHFRVFKKHEVDLQLFITMNDKDLAEMGVLDSSDRAQLLALITKLTSQQKGTTNGSSGGVARPAVFVFQ